MKKIIAGTLTAVVTLSAGITGMSFASPATQNTVPNHVAAWTMETSATNKTQMPAPPNAQNENTPDMSQMNGAPTGQMGVQPQQLSSGIFSSTELLSWIEAYYDDISDDWAEALENLNAAYKEIQETISEDKSDEMTTLQDLIESTIDDALDEESTYSDLIEAIDEMDSDETEAFMDDLLDAILEGDLTLGGAMNQPEAIQELMDTVQSEMSDLQTLYQSLKTAISDSDTDEIEDILDSMLDMLQTRVEEAESVLEELE